MLTELNIREFGLMEHVRLNFEAGMTVFTGETGAGKSILIGALAAVFGARASADWVRHGAKAAELTAVIEDNHPKLLALLDEQGMDGSEALVLRRVVSSDGRSRAWINGTPVSLKLLQQIGEICLDIHAQHEHQSLMKESMQWQWVDSRVAKKVLNETQDAFDMLKKARRALHDFQSDKGESEEKADWMRSELQRLSAVPLQEGLEKELSMQVEAGEHVAQIQHAAAQALMLVDEDECNVRSLLSQAVHEVAPLAEYHVGLSEALLLLEQVDALLGEVAPHLQDAQEAALDLELLQGANAQLTLLREAMSRHRCDELGLMSRMEQWQQSLDRLDTASWDEEALRKELARAETSYRELAIKLHQARVKAVVQLQKDLRPYLNRLGMAGLQLDIQLSEHPLGERFWSEAGWNQMLFMVSSNLGEPFKPLAQVASGGEMSRFALALKACGAFVNAPSISVFDEVDVGIGGETAWCVGELLAAMGQERQLFVVSHLPQVAVCADHQVSILKAQRDGRTVTDLAVMGEGERPTEIARMLGGLNDESLEHARQMLVKGASLGRGRR